MLHPGLYKILFELQGPHTLQACFCGQPLPIVSPWFTHPWEIPRENYLPSPSAAAVQLLQSTPVPLSWQALGPRGKKSRSLTLVLMQPPQYNQAPDPAQQHAAAIKMHVYRVHNKLLLSTCLLPTAFLTWLRDYTFHMVNRREISFGNVGDVGIINRLNLIFLGIFTPLFPSLQLSPLHELPP